MAMIATRTPATGAPPTPVTAPRYTRPALILITAVAALLYAWDIQHSQYHPFYADAVRSMTESWKAFVYGSFDPGNTITLDKLPGFLWPQALSARIFGFHPWALTLPQVIEGVLSVLVMFRAVRRWAGPNAGLLAAALFALTPVLAGLFRTAVEEPAFTLLLLLAADATQRAAREARLRSLLMAGFWVGLAFQAKMLEAFAVLPALALVYLVSAPTVLRRRVIHVVLAGAVTLAVSASWMLLVTLTPAQDRPYVDGSTNNSAVSMVVGYNFLTRFSSVGVSAAQTGSVTVRTGGGPGPRVAAGAKAATNAAAAGGGGAPGAAAATAHCGGGGGGGRGDGGWAKLITGPIASQTGWFYPLALMALGLGLVRRRGAPRTDVLRAGLLLWGTWFAVFFLVLSAGSVGGHTYYMGVVAAPLAALGGGGLVLLWRAYRAGGAAAWALPATVALTAVWGALLTRDYPSFLPLLAPVVLLAALVSVSLLVLPLLGRGRPTSARIGLLAGLAAMLIAPAAWSASVLDSTYGHSGMGTVGPAAAGHFGFGPPIAAGAVRTRGVDRAATPGTGPGATSGGISGANPGVNPGANLAAGAGNAFAAAMRASGTLTSGQKSLLAYTTEHRDGARYLFATTSWAFASPYILASGAQVLPIGGFTGQAPSPTLGQLRSQVGTGELSYVLLGTLPSRGGPVGTGTASARAARWVTGNCTAVPPADYGGGVVGTALYHCSPKAA